MPSVNNTLTYLKNFVCRANDEKYDYFWFSAIDEGWKPTTNASSVETHWGLLDREFKPKFSGDPWFNCDDYVPSKSKDQDESNKDNSSNNNESDNSSGSQSGKNSDNHSSSDGLSLSSHLALQTAVSVSLFLSTAAATLF